LIADTESDRVRVVHLDPDYDGDGHVDETDNCPTMANTSQADEDGDGWGTACETVLYNTDPMKRDSDGDGCGDKVETNPDYYFGGGRSPFTKWDFYDVTGDRTIDLADALTILASFGRSPSHPAYDAFLDRFAPDLAHPWRTGAAIGSHLGIDLEDALLNLKSFGHACS
jgi:hypothetical protein